MVSFSLTDDFNGNLNTTQLMDEINSNIGITPECLIVLNIGDNVQINFDDDLSGIELVLLGTICDIHVPIINEFGDDMHLFSNEDQFETTSSSYVQAHQFKTTNLTEGSYHISWNISWSGTNKSCYIRVKINNTLVENIKNANSDVLSINNFSHQKHIVLESGIHDIDIDFHSESGSFVRINSIDIELLKL